MPRNAAGNYSLPLPPVVTGTTITSNFENTTDADVAGELTNSLDRNGRGGMLAPFKIFDGTVSAPGLSFTQDPDNGFYRYASDSWGAAVGGAQVLNFTAGAVGISGALNVIGPAAFSSTVTFSGVTNAANFTGPVTVTMPAVLTASGSTGGIASSVSNRAPLVVQSAAGANAAIMAFNRIGTFASYFGIDTDNKWRVGGWTTGNLAYQLLHEGNSFTWEVADGFHLNSQGRNITAPNLFATAGISGATLTLSGDASVRDLTVKRSDGSGVLLFGNTAARYIFYDGARYQIRGASVTTDAGTQLGVAVGGAATLYQPLQVRLAANQQFVVTAANGLPLIGSINDAGVFINSSLWGANAVVPCFDTALNLGDATHRWTAVYASNGTIQTSDARLKKNVQDSALGLDFIESLRAVSYQWINGGNVGGQKVVGEKVIPEHVTIDGEVIPESTQPVTEIVVTPTEGKRTHYGLIAQEVRQAVLASGVVDFGGYVQTNMNDPESELGLNYGEFIAPLIKAVQELSARVKALEGGV